MDTINIINPKISLRDMYLRFCACRDFEISHVWQRAIFLTAFMIACFAGYGGLLVAVLSPDRHSISFVMVNGIAFVISSVGIIVSLLWIMMAKGSKMWYEKYEKAIEAFSKEYSDGFDSKEVSEVGGMELSRVKGYTDPDVSDWLWNTSGGQYSVSRINIFIGQASFVAWGLVCAVHILIAFSGCGSLCDVVMLKLLISDPWIMVATIVGLLLFIWLYGRKNLKSH